MDECPNCDTHPLGDGWNVVIETAAGIEINAVLCGTCGIVYSTDAGDQIVDAALDEAEE